MGVLMTLPMLGNCTLGEIPRVVLIVDHMIDPERLACFAGEGADILEIRADLFDGSFEEVCSYVETVKEAVGIPLLGTLRETEANKKDRLSLFRRLIPHVDAVDIEIDTPIRDDVIALCEGKTVIVSEHNYRETPDDAALGAIVDEAVLAGAQIVKLAVTARSRADVVRLLQFTAKRKEPLVTLSMGDVGMLSRVAAPLFGSLFTYTFVGEAVAPGQLPFGELVAEMRRYYPSLCS